jgi:hypothetical protein
MKCEQDSFAISRTNIKALKEFIKVDVENHDDTTRQGDSPIDTKQEPSIDVSSDENAPQDTNETSISEMDVAAEALSKPDLLEASASLVANVVSSQCEPRTPTKPTKEDSKHHKSSSSSKRHSSSKAYHSSATAKRASIGIQCRRDKSVSKRVGFGASGGVCPTQYSGFSMANGCPSLCNSKYKYGHLMRVETYPNGGGKVLHMWQTEFDHLSEAEQEQLAHEFLQVR